MTRSRGSRLSPFGWIPVCWALLVLGCSDGPDLAEVKGRVTLDGTPLKDASVMFLPTAGGRPAIATTDADGKYELRFNGTRNGAVLGRHEVKISTFYPASQMFSEEGKLISTPARQERLPKRYHDESELTADVKLGVAAYDFDLQSK